LEFVKGNIPCDVSNDFAVNNRNFAVLSSYKTTCHGKMDLQKDDMHQLGAEIDPLQTPTAQPAVPPTTSSPHCLVLRWHLAHRAHLRGQHGDAHGQLLQGK